MFLIISFITFVSASWDLLWKPHPIRNVWLCGWQTLPIAKHLFPEIIPKPYGGNAALQDLLFYDYGPCSHSVSTFPGRVLWFDGEYRTQHPTQVRPQDYYFGPFPTSKMPHKSLHWPFLLTELLTLDGLNSLVQNKRPSIPIDTSFLVYAASHCVSHREQAFESLRTLSIQNNLDPPEAIGLCKRGHGTGNRDNNLQIYQKYRFSLVMENRFGKGYVTEKILIPFLAGSIPIYYGDLDTVRTMFNEIAFIWYDIQHPQTALDRIAYLESNRTAYLEVRNAPILAPGAKKRWFSLTDEIEGGWFKQEIRQWLDTEALHPLLSKQTLVRRHP